MHIAVVSSLLVIDFGGLALTLMLVLTWLSRAEGSCQIVDKLLLVRSIVFIVISVLEVRRSKVQRGARRLADANVVAATHHRCQSRRFML